MVRYKEYVKKMLDENPGIFEEFKIIHDKFILDQDKFQNELNRVGEKVLVIIKEYENRVCANTERGMYSSYSGGLAEKFQNEIRKLFPMIDFIGVKTKTVKIDKDNSFSLRKIL